MKTVKPFLQAIAGTLLAGITLISVFNITSCTKTNDHSTGNSSGKIKTDTIDYRDSVFTINLPLQNQLSLIKEYFGDGILMQLRSKVDESITDFTILTDSITMQNDTLIQYLMNIRCSAFNSKQFSVVVNHTREAKSTEAPLGVIVKTYWVFSCNLCNCTGTCQLMPNGPNTTCLCTGYYECCLNSSIYCFFYWYK